ncbi:protein of unknown function [Methylocella tundrae]|uniref:Uncharacterized protein n=1 Tax=Methylocella tundrae TaxID=227605 RepID=A0A4U8Z5F6_METTU|nr:protein of unknown function [Methylocella tundrae]
MEKSAAGAGPGRRAEKGRAFAKSLCRAGDFRLRNPYVRRRATIARLRLKWRAKPLGWDERAPRRLG